MQGQKLHSPRSPGGEAVICDVKDYQIILSRDELKELKSRVRGLEAERDEYKRQADGYYKEAAIAYETRNKAIELLSERYTNLNRDGKTILDFQNTWIRQTRDENDKLRVELKTCKAALAEVKK
jgi:hypothetical protein